MSNLEHKVKTAFDNVQMPEGLEDVTMAYGMERAVDAGHQRAAAEKGDSKAPSARQTAPAPERNASQPAKPSPAPRRKITSLRWLRVAAACALAFVLCAGGVGTYAAYATETASATVQAENDVRLGVNRFGRVLSVEYDETAFDEGTKAALESLRGLDFEEALDKLLQEEALASSVDAGNVDVQIACGDSAQEATMQRQCQNCMGKHLHAHDGSDGMHNGSSANGGNGNGAGNGAGNGNGTGQGAGNGACGNGGNGHGNGHHQS